MLKKAAMTLLLVLIPLPAMALSTDEVLSLVAMPLAVAAVADLADVPAPELFDLVTLLNRADVPPAQFVEVVRYVPVAIVSDPDDEFVDFVRLRVDEGVRGDALVTVIEDRLVTFGLRDIDLNVTRPTVVVVDQAFVPEAFIPAIVTTRLAEVRAAHPHGGPPGQLKKIVGVQTGAEIVHGTKPGGKIETKVRVVDRDVVRGDVNRGPKREKAKAKGRDRADVDLRPMTSAGGPPAHAGNPKGRADVPKAHDGGPPHKGAGGPPGHAKGGGGKGKGKG